MSKQSSNKIYKISSQIPLLTKEDFLNIENIYFDKTLHRHFSVTNSFMLVKKELKNLKNILAIIIFGDCIKIKPEYWYYKKEFEIIREFTKPNVRHIDLLIITKNNTVKQKRIDGALPTYKEVEWVNNFNGECGTIKELENSGDIEINMYYRGIYEFNNKDKIIKKALTEGFLLVKNKNFDLKELDKYHDENNCKIIGRIGKDIDEDGEIDINARCIFLYFKRDYKKYKNKNCDFPFKNSWNSHCYKYACFIDKQITEKLLLNKYCNCCKFNFKSSKNDSWFTNWLYS